MQNYYYATPAGRLHISVSDNKIIRAFFADDLDTAPYSGETVPELSFSGTEFQIAVWKAALTVPASAVVTYQDIAKMIGRPRAHRAVANALGANKIAYFIPCHRVIRTDGSLGGYHWGIDKKIALLKAEGYAL